MCGLAGVVGSRRAAEAMNAVLPALAHRGPDDEAYVVRDDWALAHTRLSILDLDARSRCPFERGPVTLVYNGELWNYREQRAQLAHVRGRRFETTGDTEVVAQLLADYGARALDMMEGMYALAWVNAHEDGVVNLARDRFGEVPVHFAPIGDSTDARGLGLALVADGFAFASEVKALVAMGVDPAGVEMLNPGSCARFSRLSTGRWSMVTERYYEAPAEPRRISLPEAGAEMRTLMERAVRERAISDVPVCTLLSGGIDSTAVAYHLAKEVPNLVAYTAVFNERSQDARMARLAAERIGIELREVRVPLPTQADLADVIRRIEMPFKAQIEIGWACLHLARRMQEDGFKVCFSGEGSDELWASYGFSYHVLQRTFGGRKVFGQEGASWDQAAEQEWCGYRRGTFTAQHRKNFPRCNKVFMAHGVECRLPFLHTPLVEFALSMPVDVCMVRNSGKGPSKQKAVMYEAWDGLVPDEIVRRHKVAFQEGMGLKDAIADGTLGGVNPRVFYGQTYKSIYGGGA